MRLLAKANSFMRAAYAKVGSKVRCQRGESITETLVSVLIGGLALLMLAVVIATASRIVTDSRNNMDTYYIESNKMAMLTGGSSTEAIVSLTDASATNTPLSITNNGAAVDDSEVTFYEGTIAGTSVVSYWTSGS